MLALWQVQSGEFPPFAGGVVFESNGGKRIQFYMYFLPHIETPMSVYLATLVDVHKCEE